MWSCVGLSAEDGVVCWSNAQHMILTRTHPMCWHCRLMPAALVAWRSRMHVSPDTGHTVHRMLCSASLPSCSPPQVKDIKQRRKSWLMEVNDTNDVLLGIKGPGQVVGEVSLDESPALCPYSARARGDVSDVCMSHMHVCMCIVWLPAACCLLPHQVPWHHILVPHAETPPFSSWPPIGSSAAPAPLTAFPLPLPPSGPGPEADPGELHPGAGQRADGRGQQGAAQHAAQCRAGGAPRAALHQRGRRPAGGHPGGRVRHVLLATELQACRAGDASAQA